MDPFRVTIASVAAAALLGGIFVGTYTIISYSDFDPERLRTSESSMPAAQDALWQAFQAEDPAYLNDGMQMLLTMYGPGDIAIADAEAKHDPATGDHSIYMKLDLEKMSEAYGIDMEDDAMLGEDPFGLGETGSFEMTMAKKAEIHVLGFMGMTWAWRDHAPSEEDFTLFGMESAEEEVDVPATLSELEVFLSAEEDIVDFQISADEYEGTPSWRVEASFANETTTGDGTFHFRQSDYAPLYIEASFEGMLDSETLGMIHEQDPDFPLDDLEMRMVITFHYGPVQIDLPPNLQRKAVSVHSHQIISDTRHELTISDEQTELVPISELSVHVVVAEPSFFGAPEVSQVFARFDLNEGYEAEKNGYVMTLLDNDGDGFLSPGDQVVVTNEDGFWSNETHAASLLFYDRWAGAYEGAPAPGILWLVGLALAGAAAIRRKARRG